MFHGKMCPTCGMGHGRRMMRGGMMKAMFKIMVWKVMMHADELGLSDDQIDKLRNRHVEGKKQMIQLACQMKMDMIDVKAAVMREDIDMAATEAKVREIGKLKGDMMMAMIQMMHDMKQTLTPEQRKKIKEMMMSWFKKDGMSGMEEEDEDEGEEEEGEEGEDQD